MEEYCAACRLLADDLNAMRVGVAGGDTKLTHYECFISDEKEETSERLNLRGECEVCHEYAYARDSLVVRTADGQCRYNHYACLSEHVVETQPQREKKQRHKSPTATKPTIGRIRKTWFGK